MYRIEFAGLCGSLTLGAGELSWAQTSPRSESRVVFAAARQLARQLDEAGRDGYGWVTVFPLHVILDSLIDVDWSGHLRRAILLTSRSRKR